MRRSSISSLSFKAADSDSGERPAAAGSAKAPKRRRPKKPRPRPRPPTSAPPRNPGGKPRARPLRPAPRPMPGRLIFAAFVRPSHGPKPPPVAGPSPIGPVPFNPGMVLISFLCWFCAAVDRPAGHSSGPAPRPQRPPLLTHPIRARRRAGPQGARSPAIS